MRLTREELKELSLDELKDLLGAEFKRLRTNVLIDSPNQVAKIAGISHKTVYNLENGSHIPTKRTLQRILWVYRATEEEIDYVIALSDLAREKRNKKRRKVIKNV